MRIATVGGGARTHGADHLSLGFTSAVVLTGAAQTDLTAATILAQQLLDGHAGSREVAALNVGADAYIFYSGSGGDTVDSAIVLTGVSGGTISSADFI